jgi:ubiquinone/menaquinone biosynthesis C-methylase UbiE
MAKKGEIDYLKLIGPEGREHALNKPFSDPQCGLYLRDLGTILSLLPPPPARLLDLGVGTGWTSIFFARRGYEVVGQDISEDMISLARVNQARNGVENVTFVVGDYEELHLPGPFDCAVFYDSLHHAVDEEKALSSAYVALRPGGLCVTVEPGAGHTRSPESQKAVETYGVTEKDMPPRRILRAAKKAGFGRFKIYLRPVEPVEIGSFLTSREARELLKRAVKAVAGRNLLGGNVVVMIK